MIDATTSTEPQSVGAATRLTARGTIRPGADIAARVATYRMVDGQDHLSKGPLDTGGSLRVALSW
jgi:hypothetical protein